MYLEYNNHYKRRPLYKHDITFNGIERDRCVNLYYYKEKALLMKHFIKMVITCARNFVFSKLNFQIFNILTKFLKRTHTI